MNVTGKIIAGVFAMLMIGVGLVGASSYFNMYEFHQSMMASDDFGRMHTAMMNGDFEAAEEYHQDLDFDCPMHELVREGDVSLEEFQIMHQWMMSGDFPDEKPEGLSDAAWDLHTSHHPEIYG